MIATLTKLTFPALLLSHIIIGVVLFSLLNSGLLDVISSYFPSFTIISMLLLLIIINIVWFYLFFHFLYYFARKFDLMYVVSGQMTALFTIGVYVAGFFGFPISFYVYTLLFGKTKSIEWSSYPFTLDRFLHDMLNVLLFMTIWYTTYFIYLLALSLFLTDKDA